MKIPFISHPVISMPEIERLYRIKVFFVKKFFLDEVESRLSKEKDFQK